MTEYPPQPWDLRGQLHASVFLVPIAAFAPGELDELPPGWSLVRLGASAVVGAAWVVYEPNGVLAYRELMATVLVRKGRRVTPHIVRIWVDSPASRDGGRALWAIPKELADFEIDAGRWQTRFTARADPAQADTGRASTAQADATPIAVGSIRRGLRLPGRWPLRFAVAQTRDDAAVISPVRARAGLTITRSAWIAEEFGPLGFLAGRRALLTVTLRDFAMFFGSAPPVTKRGEPAVNVL